REHHVAAPLPYLELVCERARGAAEVGAGDHVEHNFRGGSDRLHKRSERLQAPSDAQVERQRTVRQKPIRPSCGKRDHAHRCERGGRPPHVLATIAAGLPGRVIQKRPQVWVAGRLKWTRQPPVRSTMKRPTCIGDRAVSPAQSTKTWPRSVGRARAVSASESLRASEWLITARPTGWPDAVRNTMSWVRPCRER